MTNATHSAFPNTEDSTNGLTKLEYFAAMAMQGYLSSYPPTSSPRAESVASYAVNYAKALIDELNKNQ